MLLKKDFGGVGQTTLIQIREQTRNIDSRIHLPGFFRFNFLFHSSHAVTFSTVSTHCGRERDHLVTRAHRQARTCAVASLALTSSTMVAISIPCATRSASVIPPGQPAREREGPEGSSGFESADRTVRIRRME